MKNAVKTVEGYLAFRSGGNSYGVYGVTSNSETCCVANYGVFGSASNGFVGNIGVYGTASGTNPWGFYTPNNSYVGGSIGILLPHQSRGVNDGT